MKLLQDNQQKLNDVIFANRNKAYGAYVIRAEYERSVFKSLLIVASAVMVFGLSVNIYNRNQDPKPDSKNIIPIDTSITIVCDFKKEEVKLPETKTEASGPENPNQLSTVINETVTIETSTVLTADASSVAVSTSTGSGIGPFTNTVAGTSTLTVDPEIPPTATPDTNPEFEGGFGALGLFIGTHLVYPAAAREAGIEGTVHVSFIIDENGKVESAKVLKGIGGGCDEEAVRVVKSIPKFKSPGKVRGQPVKTIFNIPIKFKLQS